MAETVKDIKETREGMHDRTRKIYSPAVDIIETNNNILVIADMPGVDEKSVNITLEKNLLTIYGMTDTSVSGDLEGSTAEYGVGDYQRIFSLTDEIDSNNIKATVKEGVLRLVLPKAESARTKRIEVTGAA
ncbi:MAG: Hsp20/alpha crystallin family protein [Nitrospirae bacterium]|nr:Hsp20/alpha crystallin family protein [Nitrospirota bacterium]